MMTALAGVSIFVLLCLLYAVLEVWIARRHRARQAAPAPVVHLDDWRRVSPWGEQQQ